jgi:hypothetical protein
MTEEATPQMPEANFIHFMSNIATQIMLMLGRMENPITKTTEIDLPHAQYLLDTMVVIQEKTKGNLMKAEEEVLSQMLYDLRIQFVEVQQAEAKETSS